MSYLITVNQVAPLNGTTCKKYDININKSHSEAGAHTHILLTVALSN